MFMKILEICELILNLIFPKNLKVLEVEKFSFEDFCRLARAQALPAPVLNSLNKNITYILPYKNPKTKILIHALKYEKSNYAAKICAKLISEKIPDIEDLILIPIPRTRDRMKKFGFSQCELIAKEIIKIKKPKIKIELNVLFHKKDFETQTKLNRQNRIKNTKNSFLIKNPEKIIDRNIILIDDVFTTGATANEARKSLLKSGAKSIFTITVVH